VVEKEVGKLKINISGCVDIYAVFRGFRDNDVLGRFAHVLVFLDVPIRLDL
jgi:hypothetical protein